MLACQLAMVNALEAMGCALMYGVLPCSGVTMEHMQAAVWAAAAVLQWHYKGKRYKLA